MVEKSAAIAGLGASTGEFLQSLDGLTAAEWELRPAAGKWSIGEIAEHTTVVLRGIERLCRTRILGMPITGAENRPRVSDADLTRILTESDAVLPAPEMVKPKGRWTGVPEIAEAMRASTELLGEFGLRELAESHGDELSGGERIIVPRANVELIERS